jgi:hypothetical protein
MRLESDDIGLCIHRQSAGSLGGSAQLITASATICRESSIFPTTDYSEKHPIRFQGSNRNLQSIAYCRVTSQFPEPFKVASEPICVERSYWSLSRGLQSNHRGLLGDGNGNQKWSAIFRRSGERCAHHHV